MPRQSGVVDEAVLTELRAIRADIQELSRRVGETATRQELQGYVSVGAFQTHERAHERKAQSWRFWAPFALSALSVFLVLLQNAGVHLVGH